MNGKKSKKIPLFVSIPHSGIKIPSEAYWLREIDSHILMCDTDAFVDDLYSPALKEFQIPSVVFEWHRYSVDVNRFSTDISPLTVEMPEQFLQKDHKWPARDQKAKKSFSELDNCSPIKESYQYTVESQNIKNSPSNIHWHKTTKGDVLIKKALSKKLHEDLIRKYFNPFHKEIKKQIMNLKVQGDKNIYLLDLHSMPSKGLDFHRDTWENRKEIVISDNKGKSCSKAFKDIVLKAYRVAGFEVALNWPYTGGAITQHYGQPKLGQHILQVELNRKLYMNEETKDKSSNYKQVQIQLKQAIAYIVKNQDKLY